MAKYRKKPMVIEAVQWTGNNLKELKQMEGFNESYDLYCGKLRIKTLEGIITVSVGNYIIRGVNGEFYPCKSYIFEKTYEIVED